MSTQRDLDFEEPSDHEQSISSETENSESDSPDTTGGSNRNFRRQPLPEEAPEKSARWYFEGNFFLPIDLDDFPDGAAVQPDDIRRHFSEFEYYKTPPFGIREMKIRMDFSKALIGGCLMATLYVPMHGLMHSISISAQTLQTWLAPFCTDINIRAIPSPSMMSEELRILNANENAQNKAGSSWQVVASLGERHYLEFRGKSWRFAGSFVATNDVLAKARESADDDVLAIARTAFETAMPPEYHPSGIRFMTVFADLQPLIDHDGDSGSVTIKVRGYIQGTQADVKKFQRWQPTFAWEIVQGGLVGSAEFESDRAAARLDAGGSSPLFEIYTVGTLGLNNAGRMQAKQASARHSIQSRGPAPLTLCRAGTRRARGRRLPRRRLGGLLLFIRAFVVDAALSGEFALSWLRGSPARWPRRASLPLPRRPAPSPPSPSP